MLEKWRISAYYKGLFVAPSLSLLTATKASLYITLYLKKCAELRCTYRQKVILFYTAFISKYSLVINNLLHPVYTGSVYTLATPNFLQKK